MMGDKKSPMYGDVDDGPSFTPPTEEEMAAAPELDEIINGLKKLKGLTEPESEQ
jgi:hypothetical protein